jgi:hypothetical protein
MNTQQMERVFAEASQALDYLQTHIPAHTAERRRLQSYLRNIAFFAQAVDQDIERSDEPNVLP